MKKLLSIIAIACFTLSAFAGKLTVIWTFTGINEGYDHLNRCQVYVDGKLVGTSSEKNESQKNAMTVDVPDGAHDIKVVNQAYYEGSWEDHTKSNNYSVDCLYEKTVKFGKKTRKLTLLFDINKEETISKLK